MNLGFCLPLFSLWYTCQGMTSQMNDRKFDIVKGVRYGSNLQTTHTARSRLECALMCVNNKSCSNVNFGSGQCELLSAEASCRTEAPAWTNGYYSTGKSENKINKYRVASSPKQWCDKI